MFVMLFTLLFCAQEAQDKVLTVNYYSKTLKHYEKWSANMDNPEFFSNFTLTNKTTKKITRFSDLPIKDRNMFYLFMSERLTSELTSLDKAWNTELAKLKTATKDQKPPIMPHADPDDNDRPPTVAEIEKFCGQLKKLRQETAVRFESLAEHVLQNNVPEEERSLYLGRIRDFHDKEKLIERKK